MEKVISIIKEIRKEQGYSHEYMAHMLDISQVAYSKIEKNETKLTVERLFKIAEILDVKIDDILDTQQNNQFNQITHDHSMSYMQQIENFYHQNKEQNLKIIELYEALLNEKEESIVQMKNVIEQLN